MSDRPTASIQWLTGCLRIHDPGRSHANRDPYAWAATLVMLDEETAELMGVMTSPTAEQWQALAVELLSLGIKWVIRRHGRGHVHKIDVARWTRRRVVNCGEQR